MTVFVDDVQVRKVQVEGVTDEGLVEAKLVPYEVECQLTDDIWEVFSRGAFGAAVGNPARIKVTNQNHDRSVIIGHAVELRDEDDGHYGKLRIADTTHGRDVLALFKAGSLSEMSVEFRPQRKHWKRSKRAGGGELWRHERATLVGVSPVGVGAYGEDARVLSVRMADEAREIEVMLARLQGLTSGPPR